MACFLNYTATGQTCDSYEQMVNQDAPNPWECDDLDNAPLDDGASLLVLASAAFVLFSKKIKATRAASQLD
ncbi:hypothetical protein [Pedobacter sp. SYSU D00535]|uniref:hypothetical protein n=1 Tax=Pedobacter sp. SYSU D00535 TaxID=2810308 RepID=UPI001A956C38|nr:hypothetical protein [Pedobacter sp. SYSU D00535]